MNEFVVALTTVPAGFDAGGLAAALVEAGVAACVHILPGIESVYLWDGALQREREQQVVIKTTASRAADLWDALRARHPYDIPEFIILPVTGGHEPYLDWIRARTR